MKKVEVIKGEGILAGVRNGLEINLKRVAAYCRVSTDSEDQLQSYQSQVKYYTDLINDNPDWTMAGIYAEEVTTVLSAAKIPKRVGKGYNGFAEARIPDSVPWLKEISKLKPLSQIRF